MKRIKSFIGYFIFFLMLMCSTKVFAAEIIPSNFYGYSDVHSADFERTIKTSDGGFAGIASVGPKDYGLNSSNPYGVEVLAKLNANMEVEWVYPLEDSDYNFTDIVEDDNKNLILVGNEIFSDWDVLSNFKMTRTGFLVINSEGKKVKEVDLSMNEMESFCLDSLAYDGDSFYSIGYYENITVLGEDSNYYYLKLDFDYGLYKFNSNFELVFFEKIGSEVTELNHSKHSSAYIAPSPDTCIDFTPDGNIIFSYNYGDNMNAIIYKYDKLGNLIFKTEVGEENFPSKYASDEIYSLVATEDNGVIAVGSITSFDKTEREGYKDALYFRLDKEGNVIWKKNIENPDYANIIGVSQYNDNYVMIGDVSTNVDNTNITGATMMIINDSGDILASRLVKDDMHYGYDSVLASDSKIYLFGYADNKCSPFSHIAQRTNAIGVYTYGDFKGEIKIKKVGNNVDVREGGLINFQEPLEGIKLCVYTKDDKEVKCGRTDKDGLLTFSDLKLGEYYIKEIETLDNYILDETKHEVTLKYKDQYTPVITYETIIESRVPTGKLEFTKTDSSETKTLPNSKIEIYSDDDILIFSGETDENGKIVVDKLPIGKFYILEKEAPEGYKINEEKIWFEIKTDGEIIKATMKGERIIDSPDIDVPNIDVPNTVQNKSYTAILCGFGLVIIGAGVVIYANKKNKE